MICNSQNTLSMLSTCIGVRKYIGTATDIVANFMALLHGM